MPCLSLSKPSKTLAAALAASAPAPAAQAQHPEDAPCHFAGHGVGHRVAHHLLQGGFFAPAACRFFGGLLALLLLFLLLFLQLLLLLRLLHLAQFGLQHFVGAFAVHVLVVLRRNAAVPFEVPDLLRIQDVHPRRRGYQHGGDQRRGNALLVERCDQRLANAELGEQFVHLVISRLRKILRSRLDLLAVLRREGAEGMLHLQAQLGQHRIGHILRILRAEEKAHALGADQLHHRLDLVEQGLAGFLEDQVRLVDEDDELRRVEVACLGKGRIDLRQQAEHEGAEELRPVLHIGEAQDADHAQARVADAAEVVDLKALLAIEAFRALLLQLDDLAQDRARARRADRAIFRRDGVLALVADELQHLLQVLQVKQRQLVVVAEFEDERHHPALRVVEPQDLAHQHRAEFAHRGPQARALLLAQREQFHRETLRLPCDAQLGMALLDLGIAAASGRNARQVPLDVHHQHRDAVAAQPLGQHLQGFGLARARSPGDQAVAVQRLERNLHLRLSNHLPLQQGTTHHQALALEGVAGGDIGDELVFAHGGKVRDFGGWGEDSKERKLDQFEEGFWCV